MTTTQQEFTWCTSQSESFHQELLENGKAHCPCCQRTARIQRRTIHASIAAALAWMIDYPASLWPRSRGVDALLIDMPRKAPRWLLSSARDFTLLRHWQLIEGGGGGLWRPTDTGRAFRNGTCSAPAWIETYNHGLVRIAETEFTTWREARGTKFRPEDLRRDPT